MLLDDVMTELDALRRARLVEAAARGGGQSVITTTDLAHVPGADEAARRRGCAVAEGSVRDQEAPA